MATLDYDYGDIIVAADYEDGDRTVTDEHADVPPGCLCCPPYRVWMATYEGRLYNHTTTVYHVFSLCDFEETGAALRAALVSCHFYTDTECLAHGLREGTVEIDRALLVRYAETGMFDREASPA